MGSSSSTEESLDVDRPQHDGNARFAGLFQGTVSQIAMAEYVTTLIGASMLGDRHALHAAAHLLPNLEASLGIYHRTIIVDSAGNAGFVDDEDEDDLDGEWIDVSDEVLRVYRFRGGDEIEIEYPKTLFSDRSGEYFENADGILTTVKPGWIGCDIHLRRR